MQKWKPILTVICAWRLMLPYCRTRTAAGKDKSSAGPRRILVAEGQILFDAVSVGGPEEGGFPHGTPALWAFALEQMPAAGAAKHDFSGAGYFETFGD